MECVPNITRSAIDGIFLVTLCGILASCGGSSNSPEQVPRASEITGASPLSPWSSSPSGISAASNLATANDTLLSEQWYLVNAGQTIGGKIRGTPGVDINALRAWTITRGTPNVIVAVIDSGVAIDHPDLAANIWTNPGESGDGRESNGIDDDGNGLVDDVHGWNFIDKNNDVRDSRAKSVLDVDANIYHGTAVASLIAATNNNGIGMSGIAPEVRIMPLKALAEGGLDDNFANAVLYARDKGARVINLSVATFIPGLGFPKLAQAIKDSPNVLVIASAGNSGNNADIIGPEPCNNTAPNLVCIASSDQEDRLSNFRTQGSNYGYKTVDMAAPGSNMIIAQGATVGIFSERFEESPASRWAAGGSTTSWNFSPTTPLSGSSSLVYQRNASTPTGRDQIRMLAPIDLAGRQGCMLDFIVNSDLNGSFLVSLLGSTDGRVFSALVGAQGFQLSAPITGGPKHFQIPMTFFSTAGKAYLGFEFNQFAAGGGEPGQVQIDDLVVTCTSNQYTDRSYGYGEGTSFSAPLVAGVAALAFSYRPQATVAQVKNALLMGGIPNPELFGRVRAPVRLDAYGTLLALDFAPDAVLPKSTVFNTAAAATAAALADTNVPAVRAGTLLTDLLFPVSLLPTVDIPGFLANYAQQPSWIADPVLLKQDPSFLNNKKIAQGSLPEAVINSLNKHGAKPQLLGQSFYCRLVPVCPVAVDRYKIDFDVAPGSQTTAKRLFDQLLRQLPSDFAGSGRAADRVRFINTFNYLETDLQTGARRPEVGSIIHINIPVEEQFLSGAEVVIADINENNPNDLYFTVLTIADPNGAMGHPVWGAREFRVTQEGNHVSLSISGLDSPGNTAVLLLGTKAQAVGWMSLRDAVQEQLENGTIPGYIPNSAKKTNNLQYLSSLD